MTTTAHPTSTSKENPVLAATEALKTGLFQPISCSDPDLSSQVRIQGAPLTAWIRMFPRKR